ncbi:uncharacterized protein LOC115034730 [Acyrthosiphon pisum]|uniref:MULE transposase domain-containing protein n=1 Tax=Acyrthosiphon pisum TaxID=7029 RepID=A0A8R2JW24_ACYPI|nr:uncharacterized protein LOC115034730 [Acyrthosiphon pisum]
MVVELIMNVVDLAPIKKKIIQKEHYGHEENELRHIGLPVTTKHEVAAKLSQGVTVGIILDDFRDNIGNNLKREDLITRADLHNIKHKYNITIQDGQLHKDDSTSVDIWVEQMKEQGDNNPVQYYKKQGVLDVTGKLELNDFCLIIMNPGQMHLLQKFGQGKVVCLDGTHGLNGYDFELVTLMVIDDFGSGFPFIHEVTGIIKPQTFMTDIVETFYSAWETVMGPVPHRLFYSWHVDKAWRQNLNKIIGPQCKEKQSTVYKSLKMLQTISSDTELKKNLNKCIIEMMNDPETKDFGVYFERMYANRETLWAYCYRKGLGVNCNMHLELMHKTIKYNYLNGYKIGRLDKSIMTIRRFTRDKKVERMIKLTKDKSTTRIQEIKKRHVPSNSLNLKITKNDANSWNVDSEHTPNSDHLKEAIKKIDALNAFIDATSKQSAQCKECDCKPFDDMLLIRKDLGFETKVGGIDGIGSLNSAEVFDRSTEEWCMDTRHHFSVLTSCGQKLLHYLNF